MSSSRKDSVVPAEVRDLIRESQKIQGWIERLADHADEARPEVFERVRDDYGQRLAAVTSQLVRHRADLVASLDTRREAVDALQADRDAHAAQLEEARLRHAVGEYSDTQWESRRQDVESSIAELDGLLQVEVAAVSELSGIIDSIGEGGTPDAADLPPSPGAPVADAADESDEDAAGADAGEGEEAAAASESAEASGRNSWSGVAARLSKTDVPQDAADGEGTAIEIEDGEAEDGEAEEDEAVEDEAEAVGAATGESTGGVPTPKDAAAEEPSAPAAVTASADVGDEDESVGGDYLDELEFLESLSLDEADKFDAVSAMLDDEEGKGAKDG